MTVTDVLSVVSIAISCLAIGFNIGVWRMTR